MIEKLARGFNREKTAEDRANLQKEKGKPWKMNESLPRSLFTFHMRRAALAATIQARLDATEKPAGTDQVVFPGERKRFSLSRADDERERDGTLKP